MKTWTRISLMAGACLSLSLSAVACAGQSDPATEEALAAVEAGLSEASADDEAAAFGELAFPADEAAKGKLHKLHSGAERLLHLKAFLKKHITCADAADVDPSSATISFTKECTWSGKRWNGSVTITYSEDGQAVLDFEGLTVGGNTLTGTMTITKLEEGHVTVSASAEVVKESGNVTRTLEAELLWTETTRSIVSAKHTRSVNGQTATLDAEGLVWSKGMKAPQAGSITHTSMNGKVRSMAFSLQDDGSVLVTVTRPDGSTKTFVVGDDGEPAEA